MPVLLPVSDFPMTSTPEGRLKVLGERRAELRQSLEEVSDQPGSSDKKALTEDLQNKMEQTNRESSALLEKKAQRERRTGEETRRSEEKKSDERKSFFDAKA